MGSGLHARVPHASPCPWVDHPVSGRLPRDLSPFRTRVRSGSGCPCLNLADEQPLVGSFYKRHAVTRLAVCSDRLEAHGFRLSFTPLAGVLFTVPSRYWFPIGRLRYLALGGGPTPLPTRFRVSDGTHASTHTRRIHASPTGLSPPPVARSSCRSADDDAPARAGGHPAPWPSYYPITAAPTGSIRRIGLGSSRFARRYSGNPLFSSGTEMFQFPRCPPRPKTGAVCRQAGCPIRRPLDRPLPARPQGFSQRGRVLHRQQAPRHPPCAHLT